ncbi:MAG: DUF3638 domain-containing protein [Chlamydiales bacterium]|nr:DUF3638 domain-containing protein [Chlamydiales bacterium]
MQPTNSSITKTILDYSDKNSDYIKQADQLFRLNTPPPTHLSEDFDEVAQAISDIAEGEQVAKALFSPELSVLKPEVLLNFWTIIAENLPKLIPTLPSSLPIFLQERIEELKHQHGSQDYLNAEWIADRLMNLSPKETFNLILPHTAPGGEKLENVVVYHRNSNGTYDITVFNAKSGASEIQEGENAIGYEKGYPLRSYTQVPPKELFGPGHTDGLFHAESLIQAMDVYQLETSSILAIFQPLTPYLSKSSSPFARMMRLEHTHSLKGIQAFFYDLIAQGLKGNSIDQKEILNSYKAINAVARLVLCMGLFQGLKLEESYDQTIQSLGILEESLRATARYIHKQKKNPYIESLFASASYHLELLDRRIQDIKYSRSFKSEKFLSTQLPHDQLDLIHHSNELRNRFVEEFKWMRYPVEPAPSTWSFMSIKAPQNPSELLPWIENFHQNYPSLLASRPEMVLSVLTSFIQELPLPPAKVWNSLDPAQHLSLLKTFAVISKEFTRLCFDSYTRFSLSHQNCGVRLLLVMYACAEKIDKKNVLASFAPSLEGYRQLTYTPYFYCDSYHAWEERQKLLSSIQQLSPRRTPWSYGDFGKQDPLAKALLDAYPEIQKATENSLKGSRHSTSLASLTLEQAFLIAFTPLQLPSFNNQMDSEDPFSQALSCLLKASLHTHMLSDPTAKTQVGFIDTVTLKSEIIFDLPYAKNKQNTRLFYADAYTQAPSMDLKVERNLLSQEGLIQTQNQTLSRFVPLEEDKTSFSFLLEEAASQSDLTISQLLNTLKSHGNLLKNSTFRQQFERYLFKVVCLKDGNEAFLLAEELKQNPKVFTKSLNEILESIGNPENKDVFADENIFILHLMTRIHSIASEMPCPPLLEVLRSYFKKFQLRWNKIADSTKDLEIYPFFLKIFESRFTNSADVIVEEDWQQYLEFGMKLNENLEKNHALAPPLKIWWKTCRLEMSQRFYQLIQAAPEKAQSILNKFTQENCRWDFSQYPLCKSATQEAIDFLELRIGAGQWEPIPPTIQQHSEFHRLFGKGVTHWRKLVGSETVFRIKDVYNESYLYSSNYPFPQGITREKDSKLYIPFSWGNQSMLKVPYVVFHEGVWWIDPHNPMDVSCNRLGYTREEWLESDNKGFLLFKSGLEKGLALERCEAVDRDVEKQLGAFGMHYHAHQLRFMRTLGIVDNYRDLLTFPNLLLPDGNHLVFERNKDGFVQKGYPNRSLNGTLFFAITRQSYHRFANDTPLKVYGILIQEKRVEKINQDNSDQFLILPFQRHISDAHSHIIHAAHPYIGPDTSASTRSMETIELKVSGRFIPRTPLEKVFCAYISLVGKDYPDAIRFLKKIRPGHRLSEKEMQVLKWMIDSSEDAQDHSSIAAAVKLKAYQLLLKQGFPPHVQIKATSLPTISMEELYLVYLNHISSVPTPFRLSSTQEKWIVSRGFQLIPPKMYSHESWKLRSEELHQSQQTVRLYTIPEKPRTQALLETWRQDLFLDNPVPLEIEENLIMGVEKIKNLPLLPGKNYPLEAFGHHYNLLSAPEISLQEKWKIIYGLETVEIHPALKVALKIAFQKEKEAPGLPDLAESPYAKKRGVLEDWLAKLLSEIPKKTSIREDKLVHVNKPLLENMDTLSESNEKFASQLKKLQHETNFSPLQILEECRLHFAANPETYALQEQISCPFSMDQVDGETLPQQVKNYVNEWRQGLQALKNTRWYKTPKESEWSKLIHYISVYSANLKISSEMELDIKRQLNKNPIDAKLLHDARIDGVRRNKSEMEIEHAFQMLLLPNKEEQLKFLQKRNPYLTVGDIEVLKNILLRYLESNIVDQTFEKIKLKVLSIDLSTSSPSKIHETWQEIGELLNPYTEPPETDPDLHLQTLLFEYLSGFRLRKQQVEILHTLIDKIFAEKPEDRQLALVFQLIMGGGKTKVILAKLANLAAKNDQVPLFISHSSQHTALKASLTTSQYEKFHQDVIDIDFLREELSSLQVLQFINQQLKEAKAKGRLLLMKTQFLQMLQLEFISNLQTLKSAQNLDQEAGRRLLELAKTLTFIKENCILIGDEIDINLNILQEVIYSVGNTEVIRKESLELIKKIYEILSSHEELADILKLAEDDQGLAQQKLNKTVFPQLVETLIKDYPPISHMIPPKNYQAFEKSMKAYMLGKIDGNLAKGIHQADDAKFLDSLGITSPDARAEALDHLEFLRNLESFKTDAREGVKESLDAIALVKECCTVILPIVLCKGFNKNYGFNDEHKIIPYLGVDSPASTEFGNIYETACYYFQAAIAHGVSEKQLYDYRDKMREAASYYADLYHCSIDETAEAKHFEAITGLPLFEEWTAENLSECIRDMKQNPTRCLDFYSEFSSLSLRYHSTLMPCNATALATMGKQFVGCSGTLWNKDTFPLNIAEACMPQEGTEGQIIVKLALDIHKGLSHIISVEQPDPREMIQSILDRRKKNDLRALADVGGILRKFSNEEVARMILDHDKMQGEIEGVVFFLKQGHHESFVLLKRDSKEYIYLSNPTKEEIEKNGVSLDKVFVYFDDLRTTGSDIPLKHDAVIGLTFDPNNTSMRSLLQGALRARGFFHGQKVDMIVQKEALEGFIGFDIHAPEKALTAENIFNTSLRNQSRQLKHQLLRSGIEQIKENYRSAILQKLIQAFSKQESNLDTYMELFQAGEWLFYNTFCDDPTSLFLELESEIEAGKFIEKHFQKIQKRFDDTCGPYLEESERKALHLQATKIVDWAKGHLNWNVTSSQVSLDTQLTVEKEVQKEIDINVEVQKETQKELQKYATRVDAPPAQHMAWQTGKDKPRSFHDYKGPSTLTFPELLHRVNYEAPYEKIFPKDLFLTENFARSHEIDLPVFHKAQKSAQHILLIRENNTYKTLFIDLQEAEFWRKQIYLHGLEDCWLCDLEGHSLNDQHPIPPQANAMVERTLWWGNFFNGNISYIRAYPHLVHDELKDENYALKYRYLRLKAANDPAQNQILSIDPSLSEKPETPPVFTFPSKQREEEWKSKEIAGLSVQELNQLPHHFVRFVPDEKIPLLNHSGFFSYLQPDRFHLIQPAQIALIPNHRIKFLCTREQVEALPPNKIVWLKGPGLKFLSEKLIHLISPEALEFLQPDFQIKYQQKMIQEKGIKNFAKQATPAVAAVILPECVPYLLNHRLACLKTAAQLAEVKPSLYGFLKASQYHLLPQENWKLLNKDHLDKYSQEPSIPPEAKDLVEQIDPLWVNDLDPRLAQFYTKNQIEKIYQPSPIKYLNAEQLVFLDVKLAPYLELKQIPQLTDKHAPLIQQIKDLEAIGHLSNEGLKFLSKDQILSLNDRNVLIRLPLDSLSHLKPEQVLLLDPEKSEDQRLINQLSSRQLSALSQEQLVKFLTYVNKKTFKQLDPNLFSLPLDLEASKQKWLTPQQTKTYLHAKKGLKVNDLKVRLEQLTPNQWEGLDEAFYETFFDKMPKKIIQCVPKNKVQMLNNQTALLWHNRDKSNHKAADRFIGLVAFCFYPFTLFSSLFIAFFTAAGRTSKSQSFGSVFRRAFKRVIFSPLRLFSPGAYYRYYG